MSSKETAETEPRPLDRAAATPPVAAEIVVVWPRELAVTVALGEGDVVFGRKPSASPSVRLADATVSREHAAIAFDTRAGGHRARDLGSRNGSRLSGKRLDVEPVVLTDGDVLRIGDVVTVYQRGPELLAKDGSEVSREAIFGDAPAVRQLRAEIAQAGADPAPVLLSGETGTGKEYVARELHRLSGRAGPLLAVNCAALSRELIESQLFGHAKGAFTGAHSASEGLFRAANGGTLLLDEIGELPAELQPKLLRTLQEREVQPVGETRAVKVDVRVIAATLRDLRAAANSGGFRLDLYARLALCEIRVPPLRRRRADLVAWLERLAAAWHEERSRSFSGLPPLGADAVERLMVHDWPDNLRGLDRVVHRMCASGAIDLPRLDGWLGSTAAGAPSRAPERDKSPKPDKRELERVLAENGGSVRATAKHFGRDRRQIYRWLEQYGLRGED